MEGSKVPFFVGSSPVSLKNGQDFVPHHRFDFDVGDVLRSGPQ